MAGGRAGRGRPHEVLAPPHQRSCLVGRRAGLARRRRAGPADVMADADELLMLRESVAKCLAGVPRDGHMAVRRDGSDMAVRRDGSDMAVRRDGSDMAVRRDGSDMAVRRDGSDMAVRRDGSDMAVRRDGSDMASWWRALTAIGWGE